MNKLKKINIYKTKLYVYDFHKLIINNYHKIITYLDDLIVIDNYHIKGENLQILKIDEVNVEILGELHEIKMVEQNNKS